MKTKLVKGLVPCFSLLACAFSLLPLNFAFADSSSVNYSLVEDRFTGGGGSASSAHYQVAETSFDSFSRGALISTNYAEETKVGIAGAAAIVALNSISPANFSKHYTDGSASFTVTAIDPDSDALQYRVKQDSTVKAGPQTSNQLGWAFSNSDAGRHTLGFEVIDPDGTVLKQQSAYVYRRPVK